MDTQKNVGLDLLSVSRLEALTLPLGKDGQREASRIAYICQISRHQPPSRGTESSPATIYTTCVLRCHVLVP